MSMDYDPVDFWNARARRHADDPVRAVGLDDVDENRCIDRVQRHLLRAALRHVQQQTPLHGKAVLDYGCGTGRWVTFLRTCGLVYHGADLAEEMLAIARRTHPGIALQPIEGTRLPYADNYFDLVWSVAVVHHNPYDAQPEIIAEMARVLRDTGVLILLEGLGTPSAGAETNYYPRTLDSWFAVAASHGLSCTWHRGATYMILRPMGTRVGRWMPAAGKEALRRRLTRIDAVIDPYLLPLLPGRFHTRAAMVFRRSCRVKRRLRG